MVRDVWNYAHSAEPSQRVSYVRARTRDLIEHDPRSRTENNLVYKVFQIMYNDAMLLAQRRLSPVMSMIQEEFPGYHPLLAIARIAHKEGVDVELAFNCHKVIAKYVEPELKSMEIKTDPDNRRRVTVSLFQEEPEVIESQSGGLVLEHDNRV